MDPLIPLYQQRLNLPNATFSRIDHEDAIVAIVYQITQPNGTQLILKISTRPKDYLREVYFLNYFAGTLPVPRIIQLVEPENEIHGAILMECLPGALLKITDLTDTLSFEIGSLLARIHLNRTAGYGDIIEPQDLSPDPRTYFTQKFEEGFAECSDHLPKPLLEQCHSYYDTHVDLLTTVDGPCMIHRDFRPGNLMIHNGKFPKIIDWASARASFAEDDFCPMEHREWPVNPTSKKSFLAGYASIRPVPDYTHLMPLLRLNRAIATVGFMVKTGTWETTHSSVYKRNRRFLEAFFQ